MFPISQAMMPVIPARQALMILDLQNDFISTGGALPVTQPPGYVERILDLARVFRESGTGYVIWIRSEFNRHRSAATSDIITEASEATSRVTRGRQPPVDAAADADAEAFLSTSPQQARTGDSSPASEEATSDDPEASTTAATTTPADTTTITTTTTKPDCVRAGTWGAEFAPAVAAAVDHRRDNVITKTAYCAMEPSSPVSQRLVQLLRVNFVHELFVCGSLTNVSVFATAMGAGQFGLATTVVSDCCGYRDAARHALALDRFGQLTGGESMTAAQVTELISGAPPSSSSSPQLPVPQPPPWTGSARRSPSSTSARGRPRSERRRAGSRDTHWPEDGGGNEAAPAATERRGSSEAGRTGEVQHTGMSPSMGAISLFERVSPEPPSADAIRFPPTPAPVGAAAPILIAAGDGDDDDAETMPLVPTAELLASARAARRGMVASKRPVSSRRKETEKEKEKGRREGEEKGGGRRDKGKQRSTASPSAAGSRPAPSGGRYGDVVVEEDEEPLEVDPRFDKRRRMMEPATSEATGKATGGASTSMVVAREGNSPGREDGCGEEGDEDGGGDDGGQQPTTSDLAPAALADGESDARSPPWERGGSGQDGRSPSRPEAK